VAEKKIVREQISRRKIYKTPCKLMLVFRRNSVMAFKCQIIKSSLSPKRFSHIFIIWFKKLAKNTIFF